MHSLNRDLASEVTAVVALPRTAVTAGGTGDATAANGTSINMASYNPARFESAIFILTVTATLAASKIIATPMKIQTSTDNSVWADLDTTLGTTGVYTTTLTLTDSGSGGTQSGTAVLGFSMEYASQYIRVVATPDMNASGTDTASVGAVLVLMGKTRNTAA